MLLRLSLLTKLNPTLISLFYTPAVLPNIYNTVDIVALLLCPRNNGKKTLRTFLVQVYFSKVTIDHEGSILSQAAPP